MEKDSKNKIYTLLDKIEDESVLNMVMENIIFYADEKDIVDELSQQQLEELDEAIREANNDETITLDDFKKEISKWKSN